MYLSHLLAVGLLSVQVVAGSAPINPTALTYQHSVQVPCAINGQAETCALDTGNNGPLTVNPVMAKLLHVSCSSPVTLDTVGGVTQGCLGRVRLIFGGVAQMVPVEVDPAWNWIPLVGIPSLEVVWPGGFTVNFKDHEVLPIGEGK